MYATHIKTMKVVAAVWGTDKIQFLVALDIFHQRRDFLILKTEELSRIKSFPLPPLLPGPGRSYFDSTLQPHKQFKNLASG